MSEKKLEECSLEEESTFAIAKTDQSERGQPSCERLQKLDKIY